MATHPSAFGPVSSGRAIPDISSGKAIQPIFTIAPSQEHLEMVRIIKIVGWVVVAVLGLVVWTFFPEAQTIIAFLLTATLIFYVFFAAVKVTVGRLVGDQLTELRLEINSVDERLELMDRKVNALLRNALEQRTTNLRDAIGAAPKQTLAVQPRSA